MNTPTKLARLIGVSSRVMSDLITECTDVPAHGKGHRRTLSTQDACLVYIGFLFRQSGLAPTRVNQALTLSKQTWDLLSKHDPENPTFLAVGPYPAIGKPHKITELITDFGGYSWVVINASAEIANLQRRLAP